MNSFALVIVFTLFFCSFYRGQSDESTLADIKFKQLDFYRSSRLYRKLYLDGKLSNEQKLNYKKSLLNIGEYSELFNINEEDSLSCFRDALLNLEALKRLEFNKEYKTLLKETKLLYSDSSQLINMEKSIALMNNKKSGGYIVNGEVRGLKKGACFPFYYDTLLCYFSPIKKYRLFNKHYYHNNNKYKFIGEDLFFPNSKKNNGPIWYNDTISFSSKSYSNSFNEKRNLKIDYCRRINDEFEIQTLPFCSDSFSVTHPSFDPVNNRLYFASNKTSKIGGADLFYSNFNKGNWSEPIRLNNNINTSGSELFPYVHNEFLYFSSDGLPGIGSLDLYEVKISDLDTAIPVNLGRNINSSSDDFSIAFKDDHSGFFTSNRQNSRVDKIYTFGYDLDTKINHCLNGCENISCVSLNHEYAKNANWITKWIVGNGDTLLGQNIQYCYSETGKYDCELLVYDTSAIDIILFHELFTINIDEEALLSPSINIQNEGKIGDSIPFKINANNYKNIFAQEWMFGDGEVSLEMNPYHLYKTKGFFEVSCSVFYNDGNGLRCCKTESVAFLNIKDTVKINIDSNNSHFATDEYFFRLNIPLLNSGYTYENLLIQIKNTETLETETLETVKESQLIRLMRASNYLINVIDRNSGEIIVSTDKEHDFKNENQFRSQKILLLRTHEFLLFEHNLSTIKDTDNLDLIAEYLNSDTDLGLTIEGHADAIGSKADNYKLAEKRILEVKEYLIIKGLDKERIKTINFGETKRANKCISCDDEERKKNRRVELIIEKI